MNPTHHGRFPEKLLLILGSCCVLLSAAVVVRELKKSDEHGKPATSSTHAAQQQEPPTKKDEKRPAAAPASGAPSSLDVYEEQEPPGKRDEVPSAPSTSAAPSFRESFDKGEPGRLPAGWMQWSSDRSKSFEVSTGKALSKPNGLAVNGSSSVAARAWLEKPLPAEVQAGAALYLNTLIHAQLLVRGSRLNTTTPTYYAAQVSRGLEVRLVRTVKGASNTLGSVKSAGYVSEKWVQLTLRARGKDVCVRVQRLDTSQYLDGAGQWQAQPGWAISVKDGEIAGAGQVGLGRAASYSGTVYFDDFTAGKPSDDEPAVAQARPKPDDQPRTTPTKPTVPATRSPSSNLPALSVKLPEIPRHYSHIRIAMLAYYGNPMGEFEDKLMKESVDLVVPNPAYLKHIRTVAPETPQLIYTNTSNLYFELFTDWLTYADQKGISREAAFYHASHRVGFRGDSPSSQPVTWFWGVYRSGQPLTNLTSAARSKSGRILFGGRGRSVSIGYPERFREVNFTLISGAGSGWSAALEYPNEVDAGGRPTKWQALEPLAETTSGLARSGQMTFDPPADWKTASVGGSGRLYYVRLRTTTDGTPPVANTILGRDYVEANGKITGAIPVFDSQADANGDGYLDDKEYAKRAQGKDARFLYESRMLTESYGQMRFGTNPSSAGFREWAVDYHQRLLKKQPLAAGFFMDNSEGKPPVKPAEVLERVDAFAEDYGAMLRAISVAIAPKWLLANTAGGQQRADPVVRQNPAYFEEFAIRPLAHHYGYFEDLSELVTRRGALTKPAPYAVIDSHPQNGTLTDPRLQMGTLAYYYLIADPESTFLMFYGGFEPASTWKRHWLPAVAYDIGKPLATWSLFADGPDPSKPALSYHVYQRRYEKALVLYKPLSHARGTRERAGTGPETATKHELGGKYQPLQVDGTLGEPITSIMLRNGEGAILVRSKP